MIEKLWTKITEVPFEDVPASSQSKYQALYREVVLRLEQTENGFALKIDFVDGETARRAALGLRKLAQMRLGNRAIHVVHYETSLYVRRGPNWGKSPNGKGAK